MGTVIRLIKSWSFAIGVLGRLRAWARITNLRYRVSTNAAQSRRSLPSNS